MGCGRRSRRLEPLGVSRPRCRGCARRWATARVWWHAAAATSSMPLSTRSTSIRFEQALDEGRSLLAEHPAAARPRLQAALALWRGEPLSGLPDGVLTVERARLEGKRLEALEARIDADLALGEGASLVGGAAEAAVRVSRAGADHRAADAGVVSIRRGRRMPSRRTAGPIAICGTSSASSPVRDCESSSRRSCDTTRRLARYRCELALPVALGGCACSALPRSPVPSRSRGSSWHRRAARISGR